ncbi:hypothetical protein M3P19_05405 [Muricauda sp. 2012CJ35-5]|uniref:Uncharacterized protein n=1 Tax=Flagellimonas spongiicola TaxID=2942208 RepID=A0ABT0PPX7_9FLAO|nr:hypothetical protein [Allomuricauda spongiicola]MCL6273435.1 hypothetical protein [Allomuricauda spongiicola]
MNLVKNFLSWRVNNILIFIILLLLSVSNFYGLFTNKFYFLKPDNYIFPLFSIIHFIYLYVVWFKITEKEMPDPKMRNLEYILYAVMIVYVFKIYDSFLILGSTSDYVNSVIPATFMPMAISILILYCLLALLTLVSFWYRKQLIGSYNFENYNDNLNLWM